MMNMMPFYRHSHKNKISHTPLASGFTLVEMMVSIGLFSMAILIMVSALISVTNESRKARAIRIVTDNVGAAVESISRSVRMGRNFVCECRQGGAYSNVPAPRNCEIGYLPTSGEQCLAFLPQTASSNVDPSKLLIYKLDAPTAAIWRSKNGGQTWERFTADDVHIDTFKFFVNGTSLGTKQPVITLLVGGWAGIQGNIRTDFHLETSVSARTPNFTP